MHFVRRVRFGRIGSWAACHRHRKLIHRNSKPVPISPGSRNLEHYDYFNARNIEANKARPLSMSPERVSFLAEGTKASQ